MGRGRSIELFFHDGDPDGMVTATIPFQWTGHVLATSRTQLAEAFKEPEVLQPGLYMLVGERDGQPTLYVGETDEIRSRIKTHAANTDKDWWETAIFVTAKGDPLNKAHARYLESKIFNLAQSIGKIDVANTQKPTQSPLSKAALAHMEDFLENLRLVLPALRFDFLTEQLPTTTIAEPVLTDSSFVFFTMEISRFGVRARARLEQHSGKFIVEAGSIARGEWVGAASAHSGYARLHKELIEQGVLLANDGHLIYTRDYVFKSSSAAAAVTAGRAATGPGTWILEGTNKTYREWEKEDLAAAFDDLSSEMDAERV